MKRRNFLKTTTALGAGMVIAPNLLLAKKKPLDKGIVYCPYIPIITASMPKLQSGEIGIIYGKTGSGKSKVIYELANRQFPRGKIANALNKDSLLIDLEVNPDMRVFENLITILRDYPRKNIYIDNIDLVVYRPNDAIWDTRKIIMEELFNFAHKQQCKIWITKQANKYWNDIKIHKKFTSHSSITPAFKNIASVIVYVYHENGKIYGDIIKNRYDKSGTIYFGKAKNLGT